MINFKSKKRIHERGDDFKQSNVKREKYFVDLERRKKR